MPITACHNESATKDDQVNRWQRLHISSRKWA